MFCCQGICQMTSFHRFHPKSHRKNRSGCQPLTLKSIDRKCFWKCLWKWINKWSNYGHCSCWSSPVSLEELLTPQRSENGCLNRCKFHEMRRNLGVLWNIMFIIPYNIYIRYNDIHIQFVWIYIVNIFTIISRFFQEIYIYIHTAWCNKLSPFQDEGSHSSNGDQHRLCW